MAIVTFVDSLITLSIKVTVNFNDLTKEEKTYTIGDEIDIDYIKDRALVSVHGLVVNIIPSTGSGTILTIDASGEFETNVVNVNINNIRKLNEIVA
ncbi:MAG: hypothetical protein M0P49_04330 [Bacilli bacterium]|jgi:hypothetical protein|nr:hypothetical protein [Bacilli bacterium]